jgi:dihydroneopterin aldolase
MSLLALPELRDCRRLFLRDHALPVRIGVHDFEQGSAQRLLVNVELFVPLADSTPRADRLEEVVDYDFVRQVIAERAAQGHIGLQETLCDDLAARLLAHPGVRAVRVSTEKPDVYADCRGVGVEVFRIKGMAEGAA